MATTQDRWQKIEALYHAALDRDPPARAAFLDGACGNDGELRREVESLLAEAPTGQGLLDRPAGVLAESAPIELKPGAQLGPYRIEGLIGEGGMGKVYRARDTRLGRTVAIKTSSARFSERFEREARAVAALNHPHICHLYDVGPDYLVMEYIEGSPIKGPLGVDQALQYAEQICGALDAAHSSGITHRDLKPGNILLTKHGIKLLDFGIALMEAGPDDPTMMHRTLSGAVMGTPAYMAPEQWEGKRADARSDIYSFGCVLYEMLTGKRAAADRGGAIQLSGEVPPELGRIIAKCLETDRQMRYQHASDIRADLIRLKRDSESLPAVVAAPPKRQWWIPSTAAALVAAAAGAWFAVGPAKAKLTDHDTIVVADFVNKTGDPAFDDTLRQGLIVQLQQSPFLSLISDQKIHATLKLMGKPADASLTGDAAREVCERVGARAVLAGSITSLGTHYVINLRADQCASGDGLDNQQADASGKDQVLKTLGDMTGRFRSRVGESLATVREHNVPLEEATTPSLEALKAYTRGISLSGTRFDDGARQFQRATELDPQFAAAWSLLAIDYSNLGETALSRDSAIRAYQARERASGPEKFNIEYSYHRNVTGNLEKAWDSVSLWRETYPRDSKAFSLSGGYAANGTGRFEPALAATEQSIRMEPDLPVEYSNKVNILFHLSRFEETEKALVEAAAHHADASDVLVFRYRLALLKKDLSQAQTVVASSRAQSENEMLLWHVQALAAARDGRLEEAARDSRRATEMARGAGLKERAAVFEAALAVSNAFYGNQESARQKAETALRAFDGREVEYGAGFALGLAGEGARAEALAAKLNKDHPEDTQVQSTYVPTLRALAALGRNDPAKAVDLLEANRRYEFAIPPLAFNHFYGNMYPLYVRGLAYLAMHREEEAAAEFNRLLAHPGLAAGDPVDALARWQLARAWGLGPAGEKTKAKSAYNDVLALWRNADRGIPILQQAQAEYARLP
jgi:tRNA A-37 threonylcarbamoyl transferase component Bud32